MVRQLDDAVTDQLRAEMRQFLDSRPDLGITDLVHMTTLSDSTGRNFMSGHCPGGHAVVGELRRVLEMARAGDILAPGGGAKSLTLSEDHGRRVRAVRKVRNFYQTQTVERTAEVLTYCAENCAIGIVTADYGVGKTEAVRAWRRGAGRKVESLVFEFDEFTCSNKVDFARGLATMLGLDTRTGSQSGGAAFRAVVQRLQEEPCLLIFDQCEAVRARVFQVIRQIWDRTREYGVGVVVLSAPILLARMAGSRLADLGALQSRVGIWAPLSGLGRAEMAAIAKQEGLTDVEEAAFDLWWRATGGSMRRLMAGVELLIAKHGGKRVTEKTIVGMASHLWGMSLGSRAVGV